jgi:hypothetical protein
VHDAAYGGNSLLANGLTPTGPMPTLRARMIAFQSGGNANCELIGEKNFPDCQLCVAAMICRKVVMDLVPHGYRT